MTNSLSQIADGRKKLDLILSHLSTESDPDKITFKNGAASRPSTFFDATTHWLDPSTYHIYPPNTNRVIIDSGATLSSLKTTASSASPQSVIQLTTKHLQTLLPATTSATDSDGKAPNMVVPLSFVEEDPTNSLPTTTPLPAMDKIKEAISNRKLVMVVCGVEVEGDVHVNDDDIDIKLEDENDEGDDLDGGDDDPNSNETTIILSHFNSLLMDLDPLLPRSSCRLSSIHALRLASAFGVSVSDRMCLSVMKSIFGDSFTYRTREKRKFRLVRSHVGVRKWGERYYGIGIAVESECLVSICEKSGNSDDDNEEIGALIAEVKCTFVQGLPLDIEEIRKRDGIEFDFGFVDGEDREEINEPISDVTGEKQQGYVEIDFLTGSANGGGGGGGREEEEQVVFADMELWSLRNDADNGDGTNDDDGDAGENQNQQQQHELPQTTYSTFTKPLSVAIAEHRNQRLLESGIVTEIFGWGSNEYNSLGVPNNQLDTPAQNAKDSPSFFLQPQSIPITSPMTRSLSSIEQISLISTSATHTLALTSLGALYACGDNSDGQLGLGNLRNAESLVLVEWFAENEANSEGDVISLKSISAGSCVTGSHSAAICEDGKLYTWGKGAFCGHIGARESLEDAANNANADNDNAKSNAGGPQMTPKVVAAFSGRRVKSVSCGGGFTVALAHLPRLDSTLNPRTALYSWGSWTGGRLGLGKPPKMIETTYMHGNTRKKVPRFQGRPRRITALDGEEVTKISAGDSHCLCATANGKVFAWGQNDAGQCGVFSRHPDKIARGRKEEMDARFKGKKHWGLESIWDDVMVPRIVPPFVGFLQGEGEEEDRDNKKEDSYAVEVAAGGLHSATITRGGNLFTWGGGGHGACLGHGECSPAALTPFDTAGIKAMRLNQRTYNPSVSDIRGGKELSVMAKKAASVSRAEATLAIPLWTKPREVQALKNLKVIKVELGDAHGACLTSTGGMYVWGGGIAAVQEKPNILLSPEQIKSKKNLTDVVEPVCVPREPCTTWMKSISGKIWRQISCGGQHTLCIGGGERIGFTLGRKLLKAGEATKRVLEERRDREEDSDVDVDVDGDGDGDAGEDIDSASVSTADELGSMAASSIFSNSGDLMSQGATADCLLLVSGRRIFAHKVVLARRCPVLRDMIYEEGMERGTEKGKIMELMLPDLRYDVCRCMVQYLYTDDVIDKLDPTQTLVYDLLKSAEKFELERLVALCKVATFIARAGLIEDDDDGGDDDDGDDGDEDGSKSSRKKQQLLRRRQQFVDDGYNNIQVPPSTLSLDFSGALGESEFADIKFISQDGRGIYAHRAFLTARSTYFNAMFRTSGALDAGEDDGDDEGSRGSSRSSGSKSRRRHRNVTEIVVPDTYVGLLRLLLYIYSGNLADGNSDALLEDLMAADRYQLKEMKNICSSTIIVTPENSMSVLDVGTRFECPRLRNDAVGVITRNMNSFGEVTAAVKSEGAESGSHVSQLPFEALREVCPSAIPSIYEMVKQKELDRKSASLLNPVETLSIDVGLLTGKEIKFPDNIKEMARREIEREEKSKEEAIEDMTGDIRKVPWGLIIVLVVVCSVYSFVGRMVSLGPIVPVFNVIFFIFAGMQLCMKLR